jgi:hypothetical protein
MYVRRPDPEKCTRLGMEFFVALIFLSLPVTIASRVAFPQNAGRDD